MEHKIDQDVWASAHDAIDSDAASIAERLQSVSSEHSHKSVADMTGFHPETVRRYRITGKAHPVFIARLATSLNVNAHWLLTGDGNPHAVVVPIEELSTEEILLALAKKIEPLSGHRSFGISVEQKQVDVSKLARKISQLELSGHSESP